jgi:hypothetical protein
MLVLKWYPPPLKRRLKTFNKILVETIGISGKNDEEICTPKKWINVRLIKKTTVCPRALLPFLPNH